jgi:hypothetical protein
VTSPSGELAKFPLCLFLCDQFLTKVDEENKKRYFLVPIFSTQRNSGQALVLLSTPTARLFPSLESPHRSVRQTVTDNQISQTNSQHQDNLEQIRHGYNNPVLPLFLDN